MRERGHQVQLVRPFAGGPLPPIGDDEWWCRSVWMFEWIAFPALRQHWRRWAPDVVIAPTGGRWSAVAVRAAVMEGFPVAGRIGDLPSDAKGAVDIELRLKTMLDAYRRCRIAYCRARFSQRLR